MTAGRRMTESGTVLELRLTSHHTVIVLVSVVDRRIVPALRFVSRLGYTDTRAVHVSVDADETRRLAADWMDLGLSWLPLHIRDGTAESLPVSVCDAVRHEVVGATSVTVVIPELDVLRWWHPLLHRRSARRIAAHLQQLPDLTTVIVPFSVPSWRQVSELRAGGSRRRRQ